MKISIAILVSLILAVPVKRNKNKTRQDKNDHATSELVLPSHATTLTQSLAAGFGATSGSIFADRAIGAVFGDGRGNPEVVVVPAPAPAPEVASAPPSSSVPAPSCQPGQKISIMVDGVSRDAVYMSDCSLQMLARDENN